VRLIEETEPTEAKAENGSELPEEIVNRKS
jgi:hypothetical protein